MTSWALSEDLSYAAVAGIGALLALSLGLLVVELRAREKHGISIVVTGVVALVLLGAALFRPVRVHLKGTRVGPRRIVLVDQSRRELLPDSPGSKRTRRQRALEAARALLAQKGDARVSVFGFSDGRATPISLAASSGPIRLGTDSDLTAALSGLKAEGGERPESIIVISDGRFSRPDARARSDADLVRALGDLGIPIHTVSVAKNEPPDAGIRFVGSADAAVAHQPLALKVEIGCAGDLACGDIPVRVTELRRGEEPAELAHGVAKTEGGHATVELQITLERAGPRVVEVAIEPPAGDRVPEDDTRTLTFGVTRDRIRLLHVAGRPTYDVRALRRWLKSDASVDLVAFFILRTDDDDTQTESQSELALIPFPVDELFTQHLPSFDAVVLQDIDARTYGLEQYLPRLVDYVRAGGGMILVGGPSSFAGGHYESSSFENVLPVRLDARQKPSDLLDFVPRTTDAGRVAPVLRPLRDLLGEALPEMPGSNTLGPARDGAVVLWEHPRRDAGGAPMPVLALGETGDGRTIALGVDGTHLLAFSEFGARAAGQGYGALWDGLLGWLMRDPRYESARLELDGDCVAGEPSALELTLLPGSKGNVEFTLERLGPDTKPVLSRPLGAISETTRIDLGVLEAGGYSARARVGSGPAARLDFACERGGPAFADPRPDPELLARISRATGGRAVTADDVASLPQPKTTEIAAERHVSPIAPAWLWALAAALGMGAHWLARRRGGLV